MSKQPTIINVDESTDQNALARLIEKMTKRGGHVIINNVNPHITIAPHIQNTNTANPQFANHHQTNVRVNPHITTASQANARQVVAQSQEKPRGFLDWLLGRGEEHPQIPPNPPSTNARVNDYGQVEYELSDALNE